MKQYLIDALYWFLGLLYMPIGWLLNAIVYILLAIPFLIIKGVLLVFLGFFKSLNFASVALQFGLGLSMLPPQTIWIMVQVGIPDAFSILSSAYILRALINLIPATVTRV